MKICSVCKLGKDKVRDFSINRANPDGRDYFCKNCKSTKAKNKRREKKIYVSAGFGFDKISSNNYIVKNCEICENNFYPIRPSHKRCERCSILVRDTQSHLSGGRAGKYVKCSVENAVAIAKLWINSDKCCYCERCYTDVNPKSVDHIIPIVKGGCHTTDNISICCLRCNLSKRDLILDEWIDLCKKVSELYLVKKNLKQ